jgi:hypothetical protein
MQITTLLYLYFWCFFLINKNYLNVISVKTNPYLYLLFKRIKKNMKLSIPKVLYIYWNSYFLSTSSRVKFSLMILKTKLKMMIYVQYMYKLHISCLLSMTFIYILYIAIIIVLVAIFSYISNFHRLLILHQVLCL